MDVSIIIVAWNVREFLYNCIKSVYEQTRGIDFEVIYVDNASEDRSVEMVRKEFPEVQIIENDENQGFIKANNQGIEAAQGRYVLLLNSDTIVLDNAIAKTIAFADTHHEAAVVGCKVLNPDRSLQTTCFMYPSVLNLLLFATYLYKVFPNSKFFGRERMTWWNFNEVREVETICGCFSLVRRTAIECTGLMDTTYFVYGDDPDWCYRFKKNGWKILFTPESEIIHYGGQTTKQLAGKFGYQLCGSQLVFMKKHRSKIAFPFACFLFACFFFTRAPYWFLMGILGRKKRERSLSTAKHFCISGFYCLTGWKRLLMNRESLKDEL